MDEKSQTPGNLGTALASVAESIGSLDQACSELQRSADNYNHGLESSNQELSAVVVQKDILLDRLTTILKKVPAGIILLDDQGVIQDVNPATEQLTNYNRDELVGREYWECFGVSTYRNGPGAVVQGRNSISDYHKVIPNREGAGLHVRASCTPIRSASGELSGVLEVLEEVSRPGFLSHEDHRRLMQEALRSYAEELTSKIRSPLAGVAGFLEMLHEEQNESNRKVIGKIIAGVLGIEETLDAGLARISQPVIEPQVQDLAGAIDRAVLHFRRSTAITVQFEIDKHYAVTESLVKLDYDGFERTVAAVLQNALESSAEQRPLIKVSLLEDPEEQVYAIEVSDHGMGMTDDVLRRCEQPFFTTKEHGLGIGLTIAQRFVTSHGGRLRIHSVPTRGTTVSLQLPQWETNHAV